MSDRYAVVGNPIAHSRSPAIHALFARQTGQALTYERLLAPLDAFVDTVERFRRSGGRGLNVTLPFKLQAYAYAGEHSARAHAAGAVNTLAFDGERVFGDNTDGIGLVRDIRERLGQALTGQSVLLLGAGGAARGVIQPLVEAGATDVIIANRSPEKAQALAAQMRALLAQTEASAAPPIEQGRTLAPQLPTERAEARTSLVIRIHACGFDALPTRADLIINATSAGLQDAALPLPAALLAGARLAYDMVYGAGPTVFMRQAMRAGCAQVSDGLGMLVEQAAESFHLWRGLRPDTGPVYLALRQELTARAAD